MNLFLEIFQYCFSYAANIFTPPLQHLAGKTFNFAELSPTRRQSKARNFETAQHIDKQKPDIFHLR